MSGTPTTPFGKQFREKYFAFDPTYTPLNHGSFGATPKPVLAAQEAERTTYLANPDKYLLHELSAKIDPARELVAGLVNAPSADNLVFVTNATMVSTLFCGLGALSPATLSLVRPPPTVLASKRLISLPSSRVLCTSACRCTTLCATKTRW